MTGHFAWIIIGGGALVLLAVAVAAGLLTKRRKNVRRGQRVSYQMAALSSAAILAVYAAGFQRTKEAADAFAARAARRREPGQVALSMAAPPAAKPIIQSGPAKAAKVADPQAAQLPTPREASREDRKRTSSVVAKNTVPPAPGKAPQPSLAPSPAAAAPAAASPQPAPAAEAALPSTPNYKDGTFKGTGESSHGGIEVSLVIEGGKIASVAIFHCWTAYSCGWVADMPGWVVDQQNIDIGWVSGATDSSWAFKDAVTAALAIAQGSVRQ